jgi:hypothetical protein
MLVLCLSYGRCGHLQVPCMCQCLTCWLQAAVHEFSYPILLVKISCLNGRHDHDHDKPHCGHSVAAKLVSSAGERMFSRLCQHVQVAPPPALLPGALAAPGEPCVQCMQAACVLQARTDVWLANAASAVMGSRPWRLSASQYCLPVGANTRRDGE